MVARHKQVIFLESLHHGSSKSIVTYYSFLSSTFKTKGKIVANDKALNVQQLWKNIYPATFRCCASVPLIFAFLGAGVGAIVYCPCAGQWVGTSIFCKSIDQNLGDSWVYIICDWFLMCFAPFSSRMYN